MTDVLHQRRKLCFKIAEAIVEHIELAMGDDEDDKQFDAEEFALLVDMHLPITHVEADAYLDEQREKWKRTNSEPRKPSLPNQLRDALHMTEDMSLLTMFNAAIDAVHERDRLRLLIGKQCTGA